VRQRLLVSDVLIAVQRRIDLRTAVHQLGFMHNHDQLPHQSTLRQARQQIVCQLVGTPGTISGLEFQASFKRAYQLALR
jgi:hypothetical protein